MAAVADAFASGKPYPQSAAELAGRRFEVRAPFGCHGQSPDAPLRYAWDEERRRLKLTAQPVDWTDTPWVGELIGAPEAEAIEGFWLPRPWMSAADCPAHPASPATAVSPETIGFVEAFESGGSRLLRRKGRAYEVTRRLGDDEAPPEAGYRLVLAGRIVDRAGLPSIACRSEGGEQRPVCLVQVQLERVALETAAGEKIADWTS